MSDKATLKAFFETGDIPTELQYADLIDSNLNTDEASGQQVTSNVEFLQNVLADKLAANVAAQLNVLDIGGGAAIGSGVAGISTAPLNGLLIEGRLGVGITSPTFPIEVKSEGSGSGMIVVSSNGTNLYSFTEGSGGGGIFNAHDALGGIAIRFHYSSQPSYIALGSFGVGTTTPQAKIDANQDGVSTAIPALKLTQANLSKELIKLDATIGIGNPIEAIGAKSFTQTHFLKINVEGLGVKYMPIGDLA